MSVERTDNYAVRVRHAVDELQGMITERYPTASFEVAQGEDPSGTYVTATVDIDDPDEVLDLVMDRMLDVQIDEGLSVYVVPVRPLERILQDLQRAPQARALLG